MRIFHDNTIPFLAFQQILFGLLTIGNIGVERLKLDLAVPQYFLAEYFKIADFAILTDYAYFII